MDPAAARRRLSSAYYSESIDGENFDHADLTSLALNLVWFRRCSFVGADLRLATLKGVYFHLCDLSGAHLRGASLRGCGFSGSLLRATDLRDCDLRAARFGRQGGMADGWTDVTGARFEGANLAETEFEDVIGWPLEA